MTDVGVILQAGGADEHREVARAIAGQGRAVVVVSTDAESWTPAIAELERAGLMIGDPADEATIAAAEEMARELFQVDDVEVMEAEIDS